MAALARACCDSAPAYSLDFISARPRSGIVPPARSSGRLCSVRWGVRRHLPGRDAASRAVRWRPAAVAAARKLAAAASCAGAAKGPTLSRDVPFPDINAADYELPPEVAQRLITPALVVHMDKVRENVRRMLDYVEGDAQRWRPHLKTTKMPKVWAELLRAGLRRFKVATTRELAVLCQLAEDEGVAGGVDVLVAYPLTGPALLRAGQLAEQHPCCRISVLCEGATGVQETPASLSIFFDVNVGMDRTGLPIAAACDAVIEVARRAEAVEAGRFRGLHCYEGHLTQASLAERNAQAVDVYDRVMQLMGQLEAEGVPVREVITSGTPGFQRALAYRPFVEQLPPGVHQISPGTVVFHDLTVESMNNDVDLLPAAVLMARVVSHPREGVLTLDAGSKSIAAESGDPVAFVIGRPGWTPLHCSEEHMPVDVSADMESVPPKGHLCALVPRHICPTVNLAEEALLVEPDAGPGEVYTVVPVAARGHELMLP